ncbi:MAG: hypothetical protein IKD96_07480 [Oscillospiraceae bacterium]|nr:hypothetical protein [Oscillospiraceae bacterium]
MSHEARERVKQEGRDIMAMNIDGILGETEACSAYERDPKREDAEENTCSACVHFLRNGFAMPINKSEDFGFCDL